MSSIAAAGCRTGLRGVARVAAAAALAVAVVARLGGLGTVAALGVWIHLLGLVVGLVSMVAATRQCLY